MPVLQFIRNVQRELTALNREAALDSMRNILAVIGIGTLLGDFLTMRVFYILPAVALMLLVWYADYLRHDFPSPLTLEGKK